MKNAYTTTAYLPKAEGKGYTDESASIVPMIVLCSLIWRGQQQEVKSSASRAVRSCALMMACSVEVA